MSETTETFLEVPPEATTEVAVPELAPSGSGSDLLLDLACGQSPKPGYQGVDSWQGAQHVVNLMRFPWPWADDSVDGIHCSHFVEHLPACFTHPDGSWADPTIAATDMSIKDMWYRFFEEVHRILKPGARAEIYCPSARHHRAFQDPTHRRFIVPETFFYLSAPWRESVGLTHYNTHVNFHVEELTPSTPDWLASKVDHIQADYMMHGWNIHNDYRAILSKLPRVEPKLGT